MTKFDLIEQNILPLFYDLYENENSSYRKMLFLDQYITEYRKIIIDLPRQTGKSTILAKLAKRHPQSYLIVANSNIKKYFIQTKDININQIFSAHEIPNRFRGKTIENTIWLLDEPHYYLDKFWNDFISVLQTNTSKGYSPTIFGLGTSQGF